MLGAYSIMRSDSIISDHSDHNAPPGDPKGETSNPTEPTGQPRIKWTDEEAELLMSLRKQDEDMPWEEIQEVGSIPATQRVMSVMPCANIFM